jgi:hypothetical protein
MRSIKVTSKVRLSAVALSITGIYYGNSLDRDDTAASHNQIVSHSTTIKNTMRNATQQQPGKAACDDFNYLSLSSSSIIWIISVYVCASAIYLCYCHL